MQQLWRDWAPSKLPILFRKCPWKFTKLNMIMKEVPINFSVDDIEIENKIHIVFHSSHFQIMIPILVCHNYEKYLQVWRTRYFWDLQYLISLQVFCSK